MPMAGWSWGPPAKAMRRPSGDQASWPARNSSEPPTKRASPVSTSMTTMAVSWPQVPVVTARNAPSGDQRGEASVYGCWVRRRSVRPPGLGSAGITATE